MDGRDRSCLLSSKGFYLASMKYGYLTKEITPDQFIFGAGQLKDSPVNPSGQWGSWLPIKENQSILSNAAFDPMACVSFATLNCVETMILKREGRATNLSDRFLAYISGTTSSGNDGHSVAEALRTKGDVLQEDWDYTDLTNTWDTFYATPPQKLYWKAREFPIEYDFGHSWVKDTSPDNIKKALTYSPLAVGVYAWANEDGLFVRKGQSNHCVMVYGYEDCKYWLVYDSYDQNIKKLDWNHGFEGVKRFTLDRNIHNESAWERFIKLFRGIFGI